MKVSVSVHRNEGIKFVNIVEEKLLGMTLKDGDKVLDLSDSYFNGEIMDLEQAFMEAKTATIVLFVGDQVVQEALKRNMIADFDEICGVKYAQLYNL